MQWLNIYVELKEWMLALAPVLINLYIHLREKKKSDTATNKDDRTKV
ncbi:hypothetical protein [Thermoflavimicrobium daqui]|nr:hypothetical protein [Thermoflavimicrobium daqui]